MPDNVKTRKKSAFDACTPGAYRIAFAPQHIGAGVTLDVTRN
jgi:hypothetical protein